VLAAGALVLATGLAFFALVDLRRDADLAGFREAAEVLDFFGTVSMLVESSVSAGMPICKQILSWVWRDLKPDLFSRCAALRFQMGFHHHRGDGGLIHSSWNPL
jgi:hypothetical protein